MPKKLALSLPVLLFLLPVVGEARVYRKATEGRDVVKQKLFPKKNKVEFTANLGGLINQSYLQTMLLHGSMSYHFSEYWGMSIEGSHSINSDKGERFCLEHFLNKTTLAQNQGGVPSCPGDKVHLSDPSFKSSIDGQNVNFGPAYVPIVKIDQTITASAVWTPIYGKQIFSFLPHTSHMDIYVMFGGGMARGEFYKGRKVLGNNNKARFKGGENKDSLQGYGANYDETSHYGTLGRPAALSFFSPLFSIGAGQKYYFLKHMFIRAEIRNYSVFAVHDTAYHNVFALWGGIGLML